MLELPPDFPHTAPDKFDYETREYKRNVISIWLHHRYNYVYTTSPVYTIWGFYNTKKRQYHSPINSKKIGDVVDIKTTSCYTAMPLNLSPLELAFV